MGKAPFRPNRKVCTDSGYFASIESVHSSTMKTESSKMRTSLKFEFSLQKFVAAMAYMGQQVPQLTKLKAVKLLFFADKYHLVKYGRPIIGDRYVKMEHGPVPSQALNWMNEVIQPFRIRGIPRHELDYVQKYLETEEAGNRPTFKAKKEPDMSELSDSDVEALNSAISRYGRKSITAIWNAGHSERAWKETPNFGTIDYRLFFDEKNAHQKAILECAQERAENEQVLELLSAE